MGLHRCRVVRVVASLVFAPFFLGSIVACPAMADDWPQWRGPRRNAVSAESGLAGAWPEGGPRIAWQASGVGSGYAGVVVSRGLALTIGRRDEDVFATALHETSGKQAWQRKIGTTTRNACSTPTVDADRVYAVDPDGDFVCLNSATGDILWQKNVVEDFAGRLMSSRGYGESPLIDGDKLVCTPGGAEAVIVALDKRTGGVIWKTKFPEVGPKGRDAAAFSSIVVTEAAGFRQYVQLTGRGLMGFAAEDGRFLWAYNAISNDMVNIPTPVVRGDLVFSANGYNAGSALVRLVSAGAGVVKAEEVYFLSGSQFQNHHGGVALLGDYVVGGHGSNNGLPTCLEFETGRILWKQRGPGVGSAAVIAADGRFYFRYQNGLVALIEALPGGYSVQGTLQIPGAAGDSWAHPAVANGRLYLREQDAVYVYDVRRDAATSAIAAGEQAAPSDASLSALRKLDVSVERFVPEKSRRLYEYASVAGDESSAPLVVTLGDKHLTADGLLHDDLLRALAEVRRPAVVSLAATPARDGALEQLRSLHRLAGLNVELCPRITDDGLKSLQTAEHLRVLILTGTAVTPAGIRNIASCPRLAALDLEVCDGIADAACEPLGQMRQLRALVLRKTGFEPNKLTNAGLERLRSLSSLELLDLYGTSVNDAGLAHLQSLTELRDLNLSLLAVTDAGLEELQPLRNLLHLELLYSEGFAGPKVTDAGLPSIAQLESLTSLNLTGARLTDAGLERLKPLTRLKSLKLLRTGTTKDGVNALKSALPDCELLN